MTVNHLRKKAVSTALAALLVTSLVPIGAIPAIDLSPTKAYAATPDTVPDCRTNKVVSTYLTKQSDGTYVLNRSSLKTREQWQDLGLVGFLLYQGYTQAADVLINPMNWYKPDHKDVDAQKSIVATNLGGKMDATAFDCIYEGAQMIKDANYCRSEENSNPVLATKTLSMLKTSPELCAIAALQANYSAEYSNASNGGVHCEAFGPGDNMCMSSNGLTPTNPITSAKNPHGLWYFVEKEYQINGQTSKDRSHYTQITNYRWELGGGAKSHSSRYDSSTGVTYVENFYPNTTYNGHTLTAVDAETYLEQVDAYIAFVDSQPSTPGSGLDGTTDTGTSTPTKPATKPQPRLSFGTSYTEGRDPNGSTAATYVLIEETGSPITLDIVLTLEGKTLTEGTDYTVEYLSNVKPGTASYSVYPAKSGQWDTIRGDFIILAKPETDEYMFCFLKSKAWDESIGGYRYYDNETYTRLRYDKPSTINQKAASIGWHKINGKSYYVYDKFGYLICWDTTIEGTPYKAQFDSASKTYYLVKDTSPKPSTGGSTTTKPAEPEKPSTGTTTTPETPSKPTTPSNPSTGTTTPSKPNPGQTTPEKPSVTPSNPTPSKPAPAVKNGWVTSNGNTYYYVKGTPLKGWQTLNGKKYYFNSNGIMAKWTQKIGNATYYFNGSGVMQTGWTTVDGKSLFFGADGKEATAKQVKKDNTKKSTAQKAVKKAKVTAKKAKGSKKALTVNWKKLSKANQNNVTGFEVQYSTKSSFKGAKTKRVSGKAKTSVKITKLKSGTKYYVRVRAYKDVKLSTGKTVRVYGSWSKKLSAKTTAEVKLKAPGFKVTDVPAGFKVTITKKSAGASGYQIRYCGGTIGNTYPGYEYKKVGKSTKTTGRIFGESDGNVVWVRAYKKVGKTTVYSAWSKPKQAWPKSL